MSGDIVESHRNMSFTRQQLHAFVARPTRVETYGWGTCAIQRRLPMHTLEWADEFSGIRIFTYLNFKLQLIFEKTWDGADYTDCAYIGTQGVLIVSPSVTRTGRSLTVQRKISAKPITRTFFFRLNNFVLDILIDGSFH